MKYILAPILALSLSAAADDYAWLEANWVSDSGSRWDLVDGFITNYSCGSASSAPYFIRPLTGSSFEITFEFGITYDFLIEPTESGFCATFRPVWDEENQAWVHTKAMCFSAA